MFSDIVCATDGSEHGDRALDYAVQLAVLEAASLHVVHVTETLVGPHVAGLDARADEEEIDSRIRAQAEAIPVQYGIETTVDIGMTHSGNIAHQIAQIARDRKADLLVIGTRGHSALPGALLGSVTQRLLHLSPCPVLAVPPGREASADEAPADTETVAG
jgi:nucleotide-binding universal stress UspA family protein